MLSSENIDILQHNIVILKTPSISKTWTSYCFP